MDLLIPVVDGHLSLIDLVAVDAGQDVKVELLPLELGVGWVPPGVGEQVHGQTLALSLGPEEVTFHPRLYVAGDRKQASRLLPESGALPPDPPFVALTVNGALAYYPMGDSRPAGGIPVFGRTWWTVLYFSWTQVVSTNLGLHFGQGKVGRQAQSLESTERARGWAQVVTAEAGPGAGERFLDSGSSTSRDSRIPAGFL
jgi:hypothetical protein